MIAYIICMNDGIEAVILDDENRATTRMDDLSTQYFLQNKHAFSNHKDYLNICYWHIHEVDVTEKEKRHD